MDLYEESCLQLHEMIENDMQSDFDCVANELCVSPQLPPLEAMSTFDSLDPSWMTHDSSGPLSTSDLDAIDVGLMVNPQTGLPISLCEYAADRTTLSSTGQNSTATTTSINSASGMGSKSAQNGSKLLNAGTFTLLTTSSVSQPQTTLTIGNTASAATPIAVGGSQQNNPITVVSTPQPLTASNVQALLGQSQNLNQTNISQPAAKKSRTTGPDENSGKVFPKPAYSYSCLIAMALKNSKTGSLPVNEIYNFMIENFPYFKTAPNGWKNSVRHNLSLNKCFEKIEKPTSGPNGAQRKGCLWAMNPSKIGKMDEEVQKWSKKDPAAIRRSMAKPERLELLEKGYLKDLYTGGGGDSVDDEDEENDDSSDVDNEIDSILPETPPTSQDEAGSVKLVKVIDSVLSEKFETSPWDTWETLQHQDENKPDTNLVIGGPAKGKPTIVTADGSTLCATSNPNTYIFTPSSNGITGSITSQGTLKIEPKIEIKTEPEFDFIR